MGSKEKGASAKGGAVGDAKERVVEQAVGPAVVGVVLMMVVVVVVVAMGGIIGRAAGAATVQVVVEEVVSYAWVEEFAG